MNEWFITKDGALKPWYPSVKRKHYSFSEALRVRDEYFERVEYKVGRKKKFKYKRR